jgi:glutamine cyclotransferase
MNIKKKKRLILGMLLVVIVAAAGYFFSGNINGLWLAKVTVPQLNGLLASKANGINIFEAEIVRKIPHNPENFVQGLQFDGDVLWEGTGLYGQSKLIKNKFDTQGGVLTPEHEVALSQNDFGEGIAVIGNMLYQLTWKEGRVYRYDISGEVPVPVSPFTNDREGWGLATNGQRLIASDGSNILTIRSTEDFSVEEAIEVRLQGVAVSLLNELELIEGKIWANVWMTPFIVVVDPESGRVTSIIDCRKLVADAKASDPNADVLNGIAWDSVNDNLYLTGKKWPWIYQVSLRPEHTAE